MHLNIPGKPFGFYIRMNSERTRCELLNLGKNAISGMHIKPFSTVRVEEGGRKVKGVKIL